MRDGNPTPQALAVIPALESSQTKGLNREDYDASRWPARLIVLKAAPRLEVRMQWHILMQLLQSARYGISPISASDG